MRAVQLSCLCVLLLSVGAACSTAAGLTQDAHHSSAQQSSVKDTNSGVSVAVASGASTASPPALEIEQQPKDEISTAAATPQRKHYGRSRHIRIKHSGHEHDFSHERKHDSHGHKDHSHEHKHTTYRSTKHASKHQPSSDHYHYHTPAPYHPPEYHSGADYVSYPDRERYYPEEQYDTPYNYRERYKGPSYHSDEEYQHIHWVNPEPHLGHREGTVNPGWRGAMPDLQRPGSDVRTEPRLSMPMPEQQQQQQQQGPLDQISKQLPEVPDLQSPDMEREDTWTKQPDQGEAVKQPGQSDKQQPAKDGNRQSGDRQVDVPKPPDLESPDLEREDAWTKQPESQAPEQPPQQLPTEQRPAAQQPSLEQQPPKDGNKQPGDKQVDMPNLESPDLEKEDAWTKQPDSQAPEQQAQQAPSKQQPWAQQPAQDSNQQSGDKQVDAPGAESPDFEREEAWAGKPEQPPPQKQQQEPSHGADKQQGEQQPAADGDKQPELQAPDFEQEDAWTDTPGAPAVNTPTQKVLAMPPQQQQQQPGSTRPVSQEATQLKPPAQESDPDFDPAFGDGHGNETPTKQVLGFGSGGYGYGVGQSAKRVESVADSMPKGQNSTEPKQQQQQQQQDSPEDFDPAFGDGRGNTKTIKQPLGFGPGGYGYGFGTPGKRVEGVSAGQGRNSTEPNQQQQQGKDFDSAFGDGQGNPKLPADDEGYGPYDRPGRKSEKFLGGGDDADSPDPTSSGADDLNSTAKQPPGYGYWPVLKPPSGHKVLDDEPADVPGGERRFGDPVPGNEGPKVLNGSCKIGGSESNSQGSGIILDNSTCVADGVVTAIADCVEEAGNIYQKGGYCDLVCTDAADYKVVEKVLEKVKTGYDGQVTCEARRVTDSVSINGICSLIPVAQCCEPDNPDEGILFAISAARRSKRHQKGKKPRGSYYQQ